MRYIFAAVAVALLVGVSTALGGSAGTRSSTLARGLEWRHHACVETKGGGATIGDLKLDHCHKGFPPISWNILGPRRPWRRHAGPAGPAGARARPGRPAPWATRGQGRAALPRCHARRADFAGTNAGVATSLDGGTGGPYSDGASGAAQSSTTSSDGYTLPTHAALRHGPDHSSPNRIRVALGVPELRVFLNSDKDVSLDPTACDARGPG